MITAEQLHDAADKVSELEDWPAEIMEFIEGSTFDNYPQMDNVSLAMGICIGIVVMQDN